MSEHDQARLATEQAQLVLRGQVEPQPEVVVNLGVPLDFQDGTVRCPDCGLDGIELVEGLSFPPGGHPLHAVISLKCRTCTCPFAICVDREGARSVLRTYREKRIPPDR